MPLVRKRMSMPLVLGASGPAVADSVELLAGLRTQPAVGQFLSRPANVFFFSFGARLRLSLPA